MIIILFAKDKFYNLYICPILLNIEISICDPSNLMLQENIYPSSSNWWGIHPPFFLNKFLMIISLFAKDKFYKLIICPILLIHFCIEHFYKPTPVDFLNIPWMSNTECSSADGKLPVNVCFSVYQEKIKSIIIVNFLIQHVCILLMNTSHSCTLITYDS